VEDRISGLKDKIYSKAKKDFLDKRLKSCKGNKQELCDPIKKPNLQIIGIKEGKEVRTKGIDNIFKKRIAEKFLNLKQEMPIPDQKASRTVNRHDQKRNSPWQIIVKTISTENKERILKTVRKKNQITYESTPIKIRADFSKKP
jgi:CDP-diacylglycerol pyrophosphatase